MTRVMDGVLGEVRPLAPSLTVPQTRRVRPDMKPINAATSRATAGVRYVTGMDGVRRAVRPASPLQVLATVAEPAAAARAKQPRPPATVRPSAFKRVGLTVSFIAVALVAAGGVTMALQQQGAVTATNHNPQAAAVAATPTPTPTPDPGLQQLLTKFAAKYPGKFNIVVKDLSTGHTATVNPHQQLTSASLYKLFVADGIYKLIDAGKLKYTDAAGYGTGRTIDGCLRVMINISDNACGRALGERLGWGKQNAALAKAGYTATNLATLQKTSAADTALLLERLYRGTLNSAASNQHFMTLLKQQRVNNRLPVGLPAGTVIAHKTADLYGYMHDAGIVYGPNGDYLVSVTGSPGVTPAMFAELSRQLWQYFL